MAVAVWIVMLAALVGTVGNVRRRRWGFGVWMVTNALLAGYNTWLALTLWDGGPAAQAVLFAAFFGLAAWGWIEWSD